MGRIPVTLKQHKGEYNYNFTFLIGFIILQPELQDYKLQTETNSHNDLCRIYCTHSEWLLLVFCKPSLAMAYFSPLPSLLASIGVIVALLSINHIRSDVHVSRRYHVTVLVRLRETIEGTDWCKLRVMAYIESNLQCFLLDQSAKGLCQTGTD